MSKCDTFDDYNLLRFQHLYSLPFTTFLINVKFHERKKKKKRKNKLEIEIENDCQIEIEWFIVCVNVAQIHTKFIYSSLILSTIFVFA